MYELIKVTDKCYYIDCPSKIGIIFTGDDTAVAIDSGLDKDVAKRVLRRLDEAGKHLTDVFVTHSHADHIGGNALLQERTGCRILAPEIECDFVNHPILEPQFLFGANPTKDLLGKFFFAEKSSAEVLSESVLPDGVKAVSLPGHCFNMVGFVTDDGVFYIADCLSSKATLEKYGVGYIYDIKSYLETLEAIKHIDCKYYVPSHAEVTEDISDLADFNAQTVLTIGGAIVEILARPLTFDDLLSEVFTKFNITMNFQQYALVGSTVKSYLTWLQDLEKIKYSVCDGKILWERNSAL